MTGVNVDNYWCTVVHHDKIKEVQLLSFRPLFATYLLPEPGLLPTS